MKCFYKYDIIIQNQFILGRGRLKNIKNCRLLWAVCLFITLFSTNISFVFAQSDEFNENSEVIPAVDPITEAEQREIIGGGTDTAGNTGSSSSPVLAYLWILLVLALCAAAIYGVVFFIKKSTRRIEVQDEYLKVLASAHLGTGRYAHVISLGTKAWLVGAGDSGVNLISEIQDQDIINEMMLENSKKNAGRGLGGFPDFKTILGRFGMRVKSGSQGADNIRKHRSRLKGL